METKVDKEKADLEKQLEPIKLRLLEVLDLEESEDSQKVQVTVVGGNNGNPDWEEYFSRLKSCVSVLTEFYGTDQIILDNIRNDCWDDIFYAKFIVYITKI